MNQPPIILTRPRATFPFALVLIVFLAGCTSQFVPSGRTDLVLPRAEKAILIIFFHGSLGNEKADRCMPTGGVFSGGMAVPPALQKLAESDPNIHLYAYCSRAVGTEAAMEAEKARREPCVPLASEVKPAQLKNKMVKIKNGLPQLKVCKRIHQLKKLVAEFRKQNGRALDYQRVFLAGTSAGAWASLLALRRWPKLANAVIGFAPAFSGKYADRVRRSGGKTRNMHVKCRGINQMKKAFDVVGSLRRQKIRYCHIHYIVSRPPPALLFAFHFDPFETPATLSSFRGKSPMKLVAVPAPPRPKTDCKFSWPFFSPHRCNHKPWFGGVYGDMIGRYVRCRVANPGRPCH